MAEDRSQLREKARKSCRLAEGINDKRAHDALIALAAEYKAQAGPDGKGHMVTSGADDLENNDPAVNANSPSKP